ncbi:MAG: Rnf-Nqr domain containing protein, partial [Oscillospiraceae bacterium]
MKKTFYLRHKSFFDKFDGLFLHNPVLARGLVVSPVIVASYSLKNSMILGIGFMIITFFTVIISSFISKKIPYTVRIILYTLIASIIFIPTAMLLDYIYPDSIFKLGIFLPLLIANSLIGVKSESRFHKHKKGEMVLDVLCNVIGFFAVIVAVGIT